MSDIPITITGPAPAPLGYTLAPTERWTPTSASATFDGTGAAGDFLPCCSIYSQTGVLLGRMFPGTMHPGDVSEVTYSPFSRGPAAAASTSLAWATVRAFQASIPPGVTSDTFGLFHTNDPAAFAIDGFGFLQFNKAGTFQVAEQFYVNTTFLGGPVANPWTTFVQGGVNVLAGTPIVSPGGVDAAGILFSPAFQVWEGLSVFVTTISPAQVGQHINWAWQNGTAVTLQSQGSVIVTELSP